MNRNQSFPALILRSRPSGESNRELWLLSSDDGLIRVTVFGGPKSRLRSYASPFHSGQAWIYHDPAKDSRKLSDFDVHNWRPGLRELYERAMAADALAETILASHGGGGNWSTVLSLAETTLDALASADVESSARILLHFFWQWAGFLGIRPETDCCSSCGKPAVPAEPLWYSIRDGGMFCAACCAGEQSAVMVTAGPGCRHWLEITRLLSPAQLARYTLDGKSFREAKALATTVLAEALGRRLASWDI